MSLRHLPPSAERLLSADDTCPRGWVDLVSARTWLVGTGHELYTTTDAGRSWRASPSSMAHSHNGRQYVWLQALCRLPLAAPVPGCPRRPRGLSVEVIANWRLLQPGYRERP